MTISEPKTAETFRIIDGKSVADQIQQDVRNEITEFTHHYGMPPGLAVVLVGDDPASQVYVGAKTKTSIKLGMYSITEKRPASVTESELLQLIDRLNADKQFHGILVQLPLPRHISSERVVDYLRPDKDVDGLHPYNIGLLTAGRPRFIPCTPYGVLELLRRYSVSVSGKEVVVLGRSNLVGRPLATLLSLKMDFGNATVTVCHSQSKNLTEICRRADILIAAIGQKMFVTRDMVKPGAVVIDVGIHRLSDTEGGGLCGDVDFNSVAEITSLITPVPKGVGPMTIAMLMKNTLHAAKLQMAAS